MKTFLLLLLAIAPSLSFAQTVKLPFSGSGNQWEMTSFDFTNGKWDYKGKANLTTETYMGKESVHLDAGIVLHTKDIDFKDGIIEFEINFRDHRNFPGLAFRMQDLNNFETFYIGAQKSGLGDATRYTPVFNGQQAWQLYYGNGHTKPFPWKFDTWHRIKLDVHGQQADVYIDDMDKPFTVLADLKREWKGGEIALYSDESDVHFANASYTKRTSVAPQPLAIPMSGTKGLVTQWQVSDAMGKNVFDKKSEITAELKKQLSFTTQKTDTAGILNLYRFASITPTSNVIVAKFTIDSPAEQSRAMKFGFSDEVKVFVNDKAIFSGSDVYGSRDFQFIGTMGFYDTVYLPLRKGQNEITFVVTEYFGGWGVKAKFENFEGLTFR